MNEILEIVGKVIDKIFPDKARQNEAKAKLLEMQQNGEFAEIEIAQKNIKAEASSDDKWTSRARPTFMYVMYVMILAAIPFGVFSAINPDTAKSISLGVNAWLGAIPNDLWWTFGIGYTGYATMRTFEKYKRK